MLIHFCEECSQVSVNRVAADDFAEDLLAVFENTALLTLQVRESLKAAHVEWLEQTKMDLVRLRLFGIGQLDCAVSAGAVS